MAPKNEVTPFRAVAREYLARMEIGAPIPIHFPAKGGGGEDGTGENPTKAPHARGSIGKACVEPDTAIVERWDRTWPKASVGLRLHRSVVGIDMDLYGHKKGAWTVGILQRKWGLLPPTWKSTSRVDGSGIWLYRIPEWADVITWRDPKILDAERNVVSGGVELIRWMCRFIAAYPSVHPVVGKRYRWIDPEGQKYKGIPGLQVADLPLLPPGWCDGLDTGADYGDAMVRLQGTPEAWLKSRPGGEAQPCAEMRKVVDKGLTEIAWSGDAGNCYGMGRDALWAVIGEAAKGTCGAWAAEEELRAAYFNAMARNKRRGQKVVEGEWRRHLERGIERQAANGQGQECVCTMVMAMDKAGIK